MNGGPDPLFASNPLPFRENLRLRNVPPVVNDVPGAIAIQDESERIEWATQASNPVAYAPHLRKAPLAGNAPRPVLYTFDKGDWVVPNPVTASILRAGELADRATLWVPETQSRRIWELTRLVELSVGASLTPCCSLMYRERA